MKSEMKLTIGHVLRHAPMKGGQGLEAALIDIAQDLLLKNLHEVGVIDDLAFKLATPPPELDELATALSTEFEFLRAMTHEEKILASSNGRDRSLLLDLLADLPNTQLPKGTCW